MRILRSNITYTYISASLIRIAWTGDVDKLAWVFIDGTYYAGPVTHTSTSKTMDVPIAGDDVTHIELHEVDSGVTVEAVEDPHEDKPFIYWAPVSDADRYRIYYRQAGETVYTRLLTVENEPLTTYYSRIMGRDVERWGGIYYWFKVEARKDSGAQSTKDPWPRLLTGLPSLVANAVMELDGASLKLTLTT